MSDFLKKIGWQEWVLLAAIVIVCFFQYSQISKFVQIPGPLYGGDLYFHYGHAMHLKEGGSVFESSHYLNEYEHYPWFYHLVVSSLSKVFGVQLLTFFNFFPIVITILAGIIFYFLMLKITKNKTVSVLTAILWVAIEIPSSHPTTFAAKVLIPLFILSILCANSLKTRALAGIAYGLCGITHVTAFLGASLIIVLFFIYKIIEREKKEHTINYLQRIKEQFFAFLPIIVIGVLIAMFYWWAPIFVYHGKTPNNWQEYASGTSLSISYFGKTFARYFLNTSGIWIFIISIISLLGFYISIRHGRKFSFPLIIFITAIMGILHPIITTPILHTSFGFYRFPNIILFPASIIFFGIGLLVIFNSLRKINPKYLAFAALLLIALNFYSVFVSYDNDQWTKVGKTMSQETQALFTAANFINKNTNVNDVILAFNEESAFAINALTGRKVVYMRATHASPYVDANSRKADAAVILYGNNDSLRKELIKKYNASYLFYDLFSAQAASICLRAWGNFSNPQYEGYTYYCLKTSPDYKEYLENNGIETQKVYARLDPASLNAPKLDLLLVKPEQLKLNFTVLDGRTIQNQTIYFIAKIEE